MLQLKESAKALASSRSQVAELTAANTAIKSELQGSQHPQDDKPEDSFRESSSQIQNLQAEVSSLRQELNAAGEKLQSQDKAMKASSADVERLRAEALELQQSRDSLQVKMLMTLI